MTTRKQDDLTQDYWQNFVNGIWTDCSAGRLVVENPGNGQRLAHIASTSAADIRTAVAAAKACHDSRVLTAMRPVERGRMVRAMGDYLLAHREEIATLLTLESRRPYWEALIETGGAARYFEYYGNQAETVEGRSIPLGGD